MENLIIKPGDYVVLKNDGYGIVTIFYSSNGRTKDLPDGEYQSYVADRSVEEVASCLATGTDDEVNAMFGFALLRGASKGCHASHGSDGLVRVTFNQP